MSSQVHCLSNDYLSDAHGIDTSVGLMWKIQGAGFKKGGTETTNSSFNFFEGEKQELNFPGWEAYFIQPTLPLKPSEKHFW